MPKKKTIVSSGYFSLNSVLLELHNYGHDIIKLHGMKNSDLEDFVIDKGKEFRDFADALVVKEFGSGRSVTQKEIEILSILEAGGKGYINSKVLANIMVNSFIKGLSIVNGTYDYLLHLKKEMKIDALLIHTAEGQMYRTLVEACKYFNIPSFCCYNGIISYIIPRYSAHSFYDAADLYYLHGEYDVEFIKNKQMNVDLESFPLVGQPSFDIYYENGKIKEDDVEANTFMYCTSAVSDFVEISMEERIGVIIDAVEFGLFRKTLPPNIDGLFLESFAKYQREINPSAKLIVALRPYYNYFPDDYSEYIKSYGIDNFIVYSHSKVPARKLFSKIEYVVSAESTIIIEALVNRKPVLYLTGMDNVGSLYVGSNEWAIEAGCDLTDQVVEGLVELTEKKDVLVEACNVWAGYYNYMDDGKAGERLAEDLNGRI